jgi:hypothetical protein
VASGSNIFGLLLVGFGTVWFYATMVSVSRAMAASPVIAAGSRTAIRSTTTATVTDGKRFDHDSGQQTHHSGQFSDADKAAEPQTDPEMCGICACGAGAEDLDDPVTANSTARTTDKTTVARCIADSQK